MVHMNIIVVNVLARGQLVNNITLAVQSKQKQNYEKTNIDQYLALNLLKEFYNENYY